MRRYDEPVIVQHVGSSVAQAKADAADARLDGPPDALGVHQGGARRAGAVQARGVVAPPSPTAAAARQLAPQAFIWRGQRYQVHAVIDHWRQRSPWWRLLAAADQQGSNDELDLGTGPDLADSFDPTVLEEEVWRVEAGAGRMSSNGVYDLAHGQQWRLVRVAD